MCKDGGENRPIDWEHIRTPEQKKVMKQLGPLIQAGMSQGATPYGGQLSAPPDMGQIAAMQVAMEQGGFEGYKPQGGLIGPGVGPVTGPYPGVDDLPVTAPPQADVGPQVGANVYGPVVGPQGPTAGPGPPGVDANVGIRPGVGRPDPARGGRGFHYTPWGY